MNHDGASHYRELFERSADAILVIDGERFVDCNQATVEMLRYTSREELLQTHPSELSPEFQADGRLSFEKANEMIATAFEKGSHRFEWLHRRADGSVFPVEVLLTAVPRDDRQVLHVVWRDITQRKRLEEELRHAHKMEAIGKLTGGIAHDFNNLLMAILGYNELLEMELDAGNTCREYVDQIRLAGTRASQLVRQLLAFSRKQIMQPQVLELNALITDIEQLIQRVLGEMINFESSYSENPLPVLADPNQIEQVIFNLATNARDAMESGGSLKLETRLYARDESTAANGLDLKPGRYAVLAISDDGQGIEPRDLPRIFDPFFTTKERKRGTGLGLSTVHGIVKQSGGDIEVTSTPGAGTTFRLFLPLTSKTPEAEAQPAKPAAPRRVVTRATILVVEDETAVANLYVRTLTRAGYSVQVAFDGPEALRLVEESGLEPDLLLTDVIMPGMDGKELADRLAPLFPGMKILFASGYSDNALADKGILVEGLQLIAKPFTPEELLERIRCVLFRLP
jgi:two-component system cell cycle sensor histidine kinase/response regulator CckA